MKENWKQDVHTLITCLSLDDQLHTFAVHARLLTNLRTKTLGFTEEQMELLDCYDIIMGKYK